MAAGASANCPKCLLGLALTPSPTSNAAPAAPAISELQPLFTDYQLEALVGRGGMGIVYRARQSKLDRPVAIKLLLPDLVADPAFVERFEREAKALAKLDHPGIVRIHDFGTAGTWCFLVMEFVDGANLRDLLAQGSLPTRDVLGMAPQLCDALQYAHEHGVVHRDIKPENILVDADGRVRLADFGLAKLLGQEPRALGLTRTRQGLGTPHYMSPEQVNAANQVDHRADLYSLGVVLYEMLTGELPIGRFRPPSAKLAEARGFDPVVMKSLENDPALRYQSARDVKRDVLVAGAVGTGLPPLPPAGRGTDTAHGQESEVAAPPPPAAVELPWHAWLCTTVLFLAAFMHWATFHQHTLMSSAQSITAWQMSMFGMPAWFIFFLAAIACGLSTLRAFGYRVPKASPLLLTSTCLVAMILLLLVVARTDEVSAGLGMFVTLLALLVWNAHELRRHAIPSLQQHIAGRTRRPRRRRRH